MNPLTLEWVTKAEGDFHTAQRELRIRNFPNYDAVCFHSQQSAEKYLKAFLNENSTSVPRTHILSDLLGLCLKIDNRFNVIQSQLNILEGYAIQFRYPGQTASLQDAKDAVKALKETRLFIRLQLGLK
jgi:HEPN domain-containing protein